MGQFAFSITNATDGTQSKTFASFSDADMTRLIAAYQQEANVSINGVATRVQVWNYIANQVVAGWVAKVKNYEQANAVAAAAAGVTPPVIT